MRVCALFPQLVGPGGVQRFGRTMAAALGDFARDHHANLTIFSLLDDDHLIGEETIHGFHGSRFAFARATLRAVTPSDLVFMAHPNLGPLAALSPRRIRTVIHAHGIDVWKRLGTLRRTALQRATLVTTSSSHTLTMIRELQERRGRIEVLHPPVTTIPDHLHQRGAFLLSVARMNVEDRDKGIEHLIHIYLSSHDQLPPLRIVGDGSDLPRLKALAAKDSRITFTGRVDDSELQTLYRECGAFALPSAKEGFGMVYAEAMAHGKPVLGCPIGGVPDVICNGESGFLIGQGDTDHWRETILRLFEDDGLYDRLSVNAASTARERFSLKTFNVRFHALLNSVMAGVEP